MTVLYSRRTIRTGTTLHGWLSFCTVRDLDVNYDVDFVEKLLPASPA